MKKVFISVPMKGRTDSDIEMTRSEAMLKIREMYPNEQITIIDSFMKGMPVDANPVFYLSKSIGFLSKADIVAFCKGWDSARGCKIEHQIAEAYGYEIIELDI